MSRRPTLEKKARLSTCRSHWASWPRPSRSRAGGSRSWPCSASWASRGAIRPVRGALPVALAARAAGLEALILPRENLPEASVVSGIQVLGAASLAEIADFLDGRADLPGAEVDVARLFAERANDDVDFAEVQ